MYNKSFQAIPAEHLNAALERKLVMLTVPKDQIPQHLEWIKSLINICSAAIVALVFKFESPSSIDLKIKISSVCFIVSILLFIISYAALINHNSTTGDVMLKRGSYPLIFGWLMFILAFMSLVARMF